LFKEDKTSIPTLSKNSLKNLENEQDYLGNGNVLNKQETFSDVLPEEISDDSQSEYLSYKTLNSTKK